MHSFKLHSRSSLVLQMCAYTVLLFAPRCMVASCTQPANAIESENCLAGNPQSQWDLPGASDPSIQGFATDISVNRGQSIAFKVQTDAPTFHIEIYRLGYYAGLGARLVLTLPNVTGSTQTVCQTDPSSGLIDCGGWAVSASWAVPATQVSGIYIAKLIRDDTGGASHIPFIVRNDSSQSAILFQTSDTTWQAYNTYGGNSLYVGGPGVSPNRAYKVSYNRPFTTRDTGPQDFLFNSEYPMVRWLEANGYDVSYFTGVDAERNGSLILNHAVYMPVGHDEYWSGTQRTNVETARDSGVHLAFFTGNAIFWKTRWEPSIDASQAPYRTLVSYKETHANAPIDPQDPPTWTGTWVDPRFSPPADGGRPQNALMGTLFQVNCCTYAVTVPQADGRMRFWRNTAAANLGAGATYTTTNGTLGYEWDGDVDNGFRPTGLFHLSTTTVNAPQVLLDYGSTYGPGTATHNLTFHKRVSGALVFGAGTTQWSWGLDSNHDRGSDAADPAMQQATVNLLADMGVQPATLQGPLMRAIASADTAPPSSSISFPQANATVAAGVPLTIAGTSADAGGGVVGGVEVSVDSGATWHPATGRENWTFTWTPSAPGTTTIEVRAVDDSGNLEGSGAESLPTVPLTITQQSCPCSLLFDTGTPSNPNENDGTPLELGVRFRSDVNGFIAGIQFYKGVTNTGTHIGQLWDASGHALGSVTFKNESASGWQQAYFGAPIAIQANTNYVAAYFSSGGGYASTANYFTQELFSAPLHALADGDGGPNGTYIYTATPAFPTQPANAQSYWVDVIFTPSNVPDTTPPTVASVSPVNGARRVSTSTTITATFSEAVQASTVTAATFVLSDPNGVTVPATVAYDPESVTATLNPGVALAYSTTYTAQVIGGAAGVMDLAGNALAATYQWTFTTAQPPPPPPDEGPGGPLLILSSTSNPFSRYYAEILRNEGLNEFTATDISLVTAASLTAYNTIILGEFPLTAAQVSMITTWVGNGGNLIAMRPDKQLATLLGLQDAGSSLSDSYLLMNTAVSPGQGLTNATLQFHGPADNYQLAGASALAMLYANANTPTTYPAATLTPFGSGQAAAFTYDLARSVVYTRQGNPAWSGQERDGITPIRSDDLFFGAAASDPEPDWVDLTKVAIPQADEQQRLLANLILQMNLKAQPLPRFWYLPWNLKAAVVMTGDDHGNGGTVGRFNTFLGDSPNGCSVANWQCVRGTSYIYPNSITSADASNFNAQGFEVALHVLTNCADYTPTSLDGFFSDQLATFASLYPDLGAPQTNRTHCVAWSDFDTQPQVELAHGIRLDTDYYYWPATWIQDHPGVFTGSGMPMRFAKADGTLIDVYQATTQMTDESGQTFPKNIDALLDNAQGSLGYFGVFTANMHTDVAQSDGADAIVASAQAHGVPVVSAVQMLTWLDGRNNSSFNGLSWDGRTLSFAISAADGANGLEAMVPSNSASGGLTGIRLGGSPVAYTVQQIKGVSYAVFAAASGSYAATYNASGSTPSVTAVSPLPGTTGVLVSAPVSATFSEAVDPATVNSSTFALQDASGNSVPASVSYDAGSQTATLQPTGALLASATYTATVVGGAAGVKDLSGNALLSNVTWTFTTAVGTPPPPSCPCSLFNDSGTPGNATGPSTSALELGVQFTSDTAGYVSGIRFLKASGSTGLHVGHLWDSAGNLLASATFTNETASGWQEATLSSPVAIQPNVTYVASYEVTDGVYSYTHSFFNQPLDYAPLHAPATGNGVFAAVTGSATFPTSSYLSTNYWADITFTTTAATVGPTIVSQPLSQSIDRGQTATLNVVATGTSPFTYQWYAGVSGDTSNPIGGAMSSSFSTPALTSPATYWVAVTNSVATVNSFTAVISINGQTVSDASPADFAAGSGSCLQASLLPNQGAVLLQPTLDGEFSGTSLPAAFGSSPWTGGGSVTVGGGSAAVDGAILFSTQSYAPGSSLEFVATFTGDPAQHVGLAASNQLDSPWILFSTHAGGALYARINNGASLPDILLPGNLLNAPHRFRIDWTPTQIVFSVDGTAVSTQSVAITSNLFVIASDNFTGGGDVLVDWFRLTPYATPCSFISRVLDSGVSAAWNTLAWVAETPAATSLSFAYRVGSTPVPDGSWTSFAPVSGPGAPLAGNSRYFQYAVTLSSASDTQTPILEGVTVAYAINNPPQITGQPASQTISYGATATLSVSATGTGQLTYQWYTGASGNTSQPISGAINAVFTTPALTASASFWVRVSNVAGSADSVTATITVTPPATPPTITAQPQSTTVASGTLVTFSVGVTGTSPFAYQWYQGISPDTSAPVSGQTGASFTTTATANASYWVQVSNTAGFANSNTATITIASQVYAVIHSFNPATDLGYGPQGALTEISPGVFFGTTAYGKSQSGGTEFSLTPSGTLTFVHSFRPTAEGKQPAGPMLEGPTGLFYGSNPHGGPAGNGTLFESTGKGQVTVLQGFGSYPAGTLPFPLTTANDGNFYGVAAEPSGGVVFRLSLSGTVAKLYTFGAGNGVPSGPLIQAIDGNLYGVSSKGVYRITLAGAFALIHTFAGAEAGASFGPLVQASSGKLYGTVASGGAHGFGYLFACSLSGSFSTVYSFTSGSDGAKPQAGLIQASDKLLYGTTFSGGANGLGTVFRFNPTGATLVTEYAFTAADGGNPTSQGPGLVQGSDGRLYGTAPGPAGSPAGVIYRLDFSLSKPAPRVIAVQPYSGSVGAKVTVAGQNLLGATSVLVNGVPAAFSVVGVDNIRITIPAGATTGPVTVTTPGGTAISPKAFTVN